MKEEKEEGEGEGLRGEERGKMEEEGGDEKRR